MHELMREHLRKVEHEEFQLNHHNHSEALEHSPGRIDECLHCEERQKRIGGDVRNLETKEVQSDSQGENGAFVGFEPTATLSCEVKWKSMEPKRK